jgi:hypothetical protein
MKSATLKEGNHRKKRQKILRQAGKVAGHLPFTSKYFLKLSSVVVLPPV